MTSDKELADKIVALGVGERSVTLGDGETRYIVGGLRPALSEYYFVRDWRVAGALMERVDSIRIDHLEGWVTVDTQTKFGAVEFEGNPVRPINEACVEALSD